MRLTEKWLRLIYIAYIFNKYNLVELTSRIPLLKALRFFMYLNPFYWLRRKQLKNLSVEARLRVALETLGPIFIKFGQALSTRRDLIPPELAAELARLQDSVPPFSPRLSAEIIEAGLEVPLYEAFAEFDNVPIASASIAQVHQGRLHNGDAVVIKVLRPGIERVVKKDMALLRSFAEMIHRYVPAARRFKPTEVVAEVSRDLFDELDLFREAANASQLRRNWENSAIHYVPRVHWKLCRSNIMVIEKIHGVPVSDTGTLQARNVDMKRLAERGVEIFYTQVFRDCFFHADMHPGNIFVDTTDPENPQYISIDFGIVGTLTREDQQYLAGNFLAFFNRDYKRVAELHIDSGWVPPDTRVEELESAIRTVCEPIFGLPLSEISFGHTLMRLFQVARRFEMEVQPQLILLQKTLLNIEGMGRQLYPDLNLWATAKPFLEKWMKRHIGFKGFMQRMQEQLPQMSEKLPELPELLFEIIEYRRHQVRIEKVANRHQDSRQEENQKKTAKHRGFILASGIGLLGFALVGSSDYSAVIAVRNFLMSHVETIGITGAGIVLWYILTRRADSDK